MTVPRCAGEDVPRRCRDGPGALRLKGVAMGAILVAGVVGVGIPLLGRKRRILRTDGVPFILVKAFAAGVILATGFVHMLHDAQAALTDPCLPDTPWRRFPFPGAIAMAASLATLVIDYLGTQYYERKHREEAAGVRAAIAAVEEEQHGIAVDVEQPLLVQETDAGSHGQEHDAASKTSASRNHNQEDREIPNHVRLLVVSQILELGIMSHSVIIGVSLGVSQSLCVIRPLIGALSFHQFFEGFALGGCISQARFKNLRAAAMASFFAFTTPAGILLGALIASSYNANSARALVVEGILDSISAGILIYMALVDLIAQDFLHHRMNCSFQMQMASYLAIFLGAGSMASLALWA